MLTTTIFRGESHALRPRAAVRPSVFLGKRPRPGHHCTAHRRRRRHGGHRHLARSPRAPQASRVRSQDDQVQEDEQGPAGLIRIWVPAEHGEAGDDERPKASRVIAKRLGIGRTATPYQAFFILKICFLLLYNVVSNCSAFHRVGQHGASGRSRQQ